MEITRIYKTCLTFLVMLAAPPVAAATRYVAEPQLESVRQWSELEGKVQDGAIGRKEARDQFMVLYHKVVKDEVPSERKGIWQWVFPVPGHSADDYSGESYNPDNYKFFDGPEAQGHPAINIYVHDRNRRGLDDRTGEKIPVVSATDGVVVSARKFWAKEDRNRLGIYTCILDQETNRFFYYAGMGGLKVSAGQLVNKGSVLGWVGRTGHEVLEKRLGTHLRFQIHNFADGMFYPVYPGRKLREAEHLKYPLEDPDYSKKSGK